tara:strand:- start:253 stop:897 length:645 start_codon:yes stop_codon:yes gene_type:complete
MSEEEASFQEKVRNSFLNAKNDISNLDKTLNKINEELNYEKKNISALNNDINAIKEEMSEIKTILTSFLDISTGNDGVINNHQQSSTVINSQQSTVNNHQQTPQKVIKKLEKELEIQFKTLTDREFSVFMAIYDLEKENGDVTYSQLANHLHLTETTVRASVNRLASKNLPVMKERVFNGKTALFIKKDFHELNLLNKLMRLRQNPTDQTRLFE